TILMSILFSSRKRHTRSKRDWSSDVCSSDLMFRRGQHQETIEVPALYGLRRRTQEVEVYDDIVLMVATKPDEPARKKRKIAAWQIGRASCRERVYIGKKVVL